MRLGLVHLRRGRAHHLVGERDLARMDRPLALAAERRRPPRRGAVAVGIGEIAERPIDRAQAVSARRHHHARECVVPHVAPMHVALSALDRIGQHHVAGIRPPDIRGARASRSGVVGHPEMQRLVARACRGDSVDVGHTERGLDDQREAEALLPAHRLLALGHEHVEGVDVRGGADLGNHDHVEPRAALLDHVDHVPVHIRGVEAIDAHGQGLVAPVDLVQGLDDVPARLNLLIRRHGVFEIQKHHVRGRARRLLEKLRRAARHRQLGAMQARLALLNDGEAHGNSSSRGPTVTWEFLVRLSSAARRTWRLASG